MRINKSQEWVMNLGLVGFHRIIKFAESDLDLDLNYYNYKIKDEYIEFDINLLQDFSNYFFEYFLHRYDSARDQKLKLQYYYMLCLKSEKFKDNLKYLKDIVKKNNDKIKKIDENIFQRCSEIYKKFGKVKNCEEMSSCETLLKEYSSIIEMDSINRIITMNKFKSILSNNYFGQSSFMNVSHSSKSIDEQKYIIQKDYVNTVIDNERLKNVISLEDEVKLKEFIDKKLDEDIHKSTEKILKRITKDLFGKKRKASNVNRILESYSYCSICGEEISIDDDYTEGNFIPLAVSTPNTQNMFWDLKAEYPIGSMCKLIMLCTAAGATDIFKNYLDDKYDYKDKVYYGFINMEGELQELIRVNNDFGNRSDKNISFESFILDSISQNEKISEWQLNNILYVEFNADYASKKCKLNYFNIPNYLARFIKYNANLIKKIKNSKTRFQVFDIMLARKDLGKFVDRKLRDKFRNTIEIFQLVKISHYLRIYKGGEDVNNNLNIKQLNFIYMKGKELSKIIKNENQENKIQGIVYKLLNAAKSNNRADFMDIVLRIHLTYRQEVPILFLDIFKEEKLSFEEIAHAFITGILSKEDEKGEKNYE